MNSGDTQKHQADLIPIGQAARTLGVSIDTIRRWESEGKLSAVRTLGGQRRFDRQYIEDLAKAAS